MGAQQITENTIYEILSNYFWMIKEIERLDEILKGTEFAGVAQYGIEATMPKPQGGLTKDAIANEIARRDKKMARRLRLVSKVEYIQKRIERVQDEREKVVLDCLLDGMSINAISNHLGLTRRHINNLRRNIVHTMMD